MNKICYLILFECFKDRQITYEITPVHLKLKKNQKDKKSCILFFTCVFFITEVKQNLIEAVPAADSQPKLLGSLECCWE